MKTLKKIMMGVITIALVFVMTLGNASAVSAPSTITVKEADYTRDFVGISNFGMTMFTTTDGTVIYCMDIDKKPLASGMTATFSENGDAGLLYILQNGYPKKTYKNNRGMDAEITQMAIWWYLSESKLSSEFKNANDQYGIVTSTKKLVTEARNAKDTQATPSMKVSNDGTTLTLTSDKKYYESGYMSATLTGAKTYNVSVNGGTKGTTVVDASGNTKTSFNSGDKFKVRVPASEVSSKLNITVSYSATGSVQKAKIYKPADTSYQRVVGLYEDEINLSEKTTLSLTPVRSCEYTGGKYYGKEGNEVDEKQYNKECGHVCEYTDGKYYGRDGKVVGKKTYEKECSKSCEYTDGKYYGKDGKVVDKKIYEKECGTSHICEYTDDKYYGASGVEVDKSTFDKECGSEVVVPNTSSNVSPLAITLGIILMSAGAYTIIYRKKQLS